MLQVCRRSQLDRTPADGAKEMLPNAETSGDENAPYHNRLTCLPAYISRSSLHRLTSKMRIMKSKGAMRSREHTSQTRGIFPPLDSLGD